MFYILDDLGYIEETSSHYIERDEKTCTEYTGTIPEGYDSLEEWALYANIRAYKLDTNRNLIFDEIRDAELQEEYATTAKKNIMTIKLVNSITCVNAVYTNIKFDTLYNSIGNKLSFENGGIKIGAGVSKVLVSANLRYDIGSTGAKHGRIAKNGDPIAWNMSNVFNANEDFSLSFPSMLVDVEEGDMIYVQYYASSSDKVYGHNVNLTNYLTIEVVD
ncbi:MAG: hypothetical protein J6Q96_01070 [Bacteroidales bacterium]|nr:hypothetical protein [Bacteroidales bacterium]